MADHVLRQVCRSSRRTIYHLPDPDDPDRPACYGRWGDGRIADSEYRRTDPAVLGEHYRLCRYCDPDVDQDYGRAQGTPLATRLQDMDPDDLPVGGGDG